MDEESAWKRFTESGSVSDYLTYCCIKLGYQPEDVHQTGEEPYDLQHRGIDPEGTTHRREG